MFDKEKFICTELTHPRLFSLLLYQIPVDREETREKWTEHEINVNLISQIKSISCQLCRFFCYCFVHLLSISTTTFIYSDLLHKDRRLEIKMCLGSMLLRDWEINFLWTSTETIIERTFDQEYITNLAKWWWKLKGEEKASLVSLSRETISCSTQTRYITEPFVLEQNWTQEKDVMRIRWKLILFFFSVTRSSCEQHENPFLRVPNDSSYSKTVKRERQRIIAPSHTMIRKVNSLVDEEARKKGKISEEKTQARRKIISTRAKQQRSCPLNFNGNMYLIENGIVKFSLFIFTPHIFSPLSLSISLSFSLSRST